ncbi:MAG TPA: ABC transporter permease [Candidatus Sulfotelmatobacter sp.]|nr:ABC transporter permease [Candidatus Sulfotelmatobacter sp.]
MSDLGQDVRYALRQLRRNPGFTAIAVLTLALGIGANSAIFSVVDAVVLHPLPYRDPKQLVLVKERIPMASPEPIPVCAPDVVQLQRENQVFTGAAAFVGGAFDLSGQTAPQRVVAERVNSNLFSVLGAEPAVGRTFTADEDQPGHLVAMLSYGIWQRRFGSDANILGQTITLDRRPYTVVGVMPQSFTFPLPGMAQGEPADVFVPMAFTHDELSTIGDNFNFSVMARLKPGVSLAQADADLLTIAHHILETYPPQFRDSAKLEALALPLTNQVIGNAKTLLLLLLGAVGFVLLIACANVANLLLSRAADRQRELALRRALGAKTIQLFRQWTVESMLLATIGAGLGLALAFWATETLVHLIPASIPRVNEIGVNLPVLAFTLGLAVITGLVFGIVPAFASTRMELNDALKEGGRSAVQGPQHHRMRGVLVVAEIALSMVLLVGAGLLMRSFQRVLETNSGVQSEHVLTASLSLPDAQYTAATQVRSFYRDLMSRLEQLPGIRTAGASTDLPLEGSWLEIFTPEGYQPPPGAGLNTCFNSMILGNYLQTIGVPLIHGRFFTEQDKLDSTPVVIVSESLAQRYWPNQDPVGKRIKQGPPESTDPWITIVGVVGDVKQRSLDTPTAPHTYRPFPQYDPPAKALNLVVRATGDPASVGSEVRMAVWGLDRELAIAQVRTMDQVIHESTASRRFTLLLLAAFALLAVVLAAIGIYGVIAYTVVRRTHEIGIRLALGAHQHDVMRLVLGQGLRLAIIGMALGCAAAFFLSRLLASLLFEVRPTDPVTFAGGMLFLASIAMLASYIPGRRAAKVDPVEALRYE